MFPRLVSAKVAQFTALIAVSVILTAPILYPVFARARENALRSSCQSNLKRIGLAFEMYRVDNSSYPADRDGKTGRGWTEALTPYTKTLVVYHCPIAPEGPVVGDYVGAARTDYFMNRRFSASRGVSGENAALAILTGDGQASVNASSGNYSLSALPAEWRAGGASPSTRHLDGANYGFADGHVKWLLPHRVQTTALREGMPTFAVN